MRVFFCNKNLFEMTVRIVSYNLLVPKLAQPKFYPECERKYLNWSYRFDLIRFHLKQEIVYNRNTIVCLQEVCRQTLPELKELFHQLKYILLFDLYGEEFDDYMGIAIAIPETMKVTSVSRIKIGEYLRTRLIDKQSSLFKRLKMMLTHRQDPNDPWQIAMMKRNVLMCLHVYIDGIPLCIGTYHMPAMFQMPSVMMIHASVVKDILFQLANGVNLIFAGDFNTKPQDEYYSVLTQQGFINDRLPRSSNYQINYRPLSNHVFRSAYKELNGSEPAFTNYSSTLKSPSFCATLDYIFFAGQLLVDKVLILPNHPKGRSYPDEKHPSDHLMIAATFKFI